MPSTIEVIDRWTGAGRTDEEIVPPPPHEDGWHPSAQRGMFEHWYFDARLDDGHVIVGFLQSSELITKKPGVELHVYKPDGSRIEIRKPYPHAAVKASTAGCEVSVGANRVTTDYPEDGLPIFHLQLDEDGVHFDLDFHAEVPAWQPGMGRTNYGPRDYFAWVVGAPRARVHGTIEYENKSSRSRGSATTTTTGVWATWAGSSTTGTGAGSTPRTTRSSTPTCSRASATPITRPVR